MREHTDKILLPSPTVTSFFTPLHPLLRSFYLPLPSVSSSPPAFSHPHQQFVNVIYSPHISHPIRSSSALFEECKSPLSLVLPQHCATSLEVPALLARLDLFTLAQMVGGWTVHHKSGDTEVVASCYRLVQPLASCQDPFCPNVILLSSEKQPHPLNLPALSFTALEAATSTERMSRWCPGTSFYWTGGYLSLCFYSLVTSFTLVVFKMSAV